MERWQFWIDRGGTFTDCLGLDPKTGELHVAKVLSSDQAPLVAIREILGLDHDLPIPPCEVRMGTTVATNALLERKGTPCALAITRGFGDLLEIGTQARPEIFALEIEKPERLYRDAVEIDARLDAEGRILSRPDPKALKEGLLAARRSGAKSLAVIVMHAYRDGALEEEIAEAARAAGFEHVSMSHEVDAEIGMVARGDTTTVDAYLTPLIKRYVGSLLSALPQSRLAIMQSSGGLADATHFRGRNAILSGPAGGVIAYAHVAKEAGFPRAIGFDMGGTSTDVSRYDGELERVYESELAGVRLRAPMMAIHTVAAGGGSLCRYDGYRLTVGPKSAGAIPGPLCYGHAEARELTLSDIDLALGRLLPDRFPFPLDEARVVAALDGVAAVLSQKGARKSRLEIAEGFFEVANAGMAEAIRRVSVAQGYDVRDYTLVVFGGAGGQHACAIARRLGMRSILFHPYAGVLSAYGMGLADLTWNGEADAGRVRLDPSVDARVEPLFRELEARGEEAIAAQGAPRSRIACVRRLELRYQGTETSIALPYPQDQLEDGLRRAFEARHQRQFGYTRAGHPIEVVTARVEAIGRSATASAPDPSNRTPSPETTRTGQLFLGGALHSNVPVLFRESIAAGTRLPGPAVVLESTATIVVDPGFELHMDEKGRIILYDRAPNTRSPKADTAVDPVRLEIFNNLYMSIAAQMGTVLRRTALSTNIRERLDFSCAVFDKEGGLVANAPHIPVHLGAMGESIKGVLAVHPDPKPGDVFVTNDPATGGSHLPDITVITPAHDANHELLFFTASRGHHADIGGITPGSMPPFSSSLDEEGIVLSALKIVSSGAFDEPAVLSALTRGPYPARAPRQNLADLEAQIAANAHGARLLLEMAAEHGRDVVEAYMRHVQDNAASSVADAIRKLPKGEHRFTDQLDDGTPIAVTLRIHDATMEIDFSGTGPENVRGNLNAPRAVTIAAVIYVLRALVGAPIPLNGGCLRPVTLHIPEGSILSPSPARAVAGGNVETSQRIVDVLLGALGRAAASQGTMNNLTFGNDRFGYYETIAGGSGATQGHKGASGVHTHMTNTRITDPEFLESRFPVRLLQLAIRRGSGGTGRWPGGDGLIRELQFLQPTRVSILSERRATRPFGLKGGGSGLRGENLHQNRDVGGKATFDAAPGDVLCIKTPGGGGFGV